MKIQKEVMELPTLGERLREIREFCGLSQAEAATILAVGRSAISLWERDENAPSAAKLQEIGKIYGVSLDWLFGVDGADSFSPALVQGLMALARHLRRLSEQGLRDLEWASTEERLAHCLHFLQQRVPDLCTTAFFARRLVLPEPMLQEILAGKMLASSSTIDRAANLLRLPAMWLRTGDSSYMGPVQHSEFEALAMRMQEEGITPSQVLKVLEFVKAMK